MDKLQEDMEISRIKGKNADQQKPQQDAGTITHSPRDYQPTKAEKEAAIDMPDADIDAVRSAFFRPIGVKKPKE